MHGPQTGGPPVGLGSFPVMSDEEFGRWVRLLEQRTGVVVPPTRKPFLVANLRMRMRETGHQAFDEYYDRVLSGAGGAVEWATLVDRLTVHETHFFRHMPSLDLVRDHLLGLPVGPDEDFKLHAWSVGCSTGEEAYSLAMVMDKTLAARTEQYYFGVIATDVSLPAIAAGKAASYGLDRLAEIPEDYRVTYTRPGEGEHFLIEESIRRRVGFAMLNLLDVARAPIRDMDVIFCQNVLIYFPRSRRPALLEELGRRLKPGGLLIVGPGEIINWNHPGLDRVAHRQVLAYRRRASD